MHNIYVNEVLILWKDTEHYSMNSYGIKFKIKMKGFYVKGLILKKQRLKPY